jgi:DNA polymerase III delta subunit
MVSKEAWLYLFIGQNDFSKNDSSKDAKLKEIKKSLLSPALENFNLDTLYAKGLELKELQEKLLCLPVKTKKRLLIIKDAQALKEEVRDFLLEYIKKPPSHLVLILDSGHYDPKDNFIQQLARLAQTFRFKEELRIDAFALGRQIELGRADYALRVLNQLLKEGEKPERILGGLRHSLLRMGGSPIEMRRRLKILLGCDIEMKSGRLKPAFALEKAAVALCRLRGLAR